MVSRRRIMRNMFGAVKKEKEWRRLKNEEIYATMKEPNSVIKAKAERLQLAGHVATMTVDAI